MKVYFKFSWLFGWLDASVKFIEVLLEESWEKESKCTNSLSLNSTILGKYCDFASKIYWITLYLAAKPMLTA